VDQCRIIETQTFHGHFWRLKLEKNTKIPDRRRGQQQQIQEYLQRKNHIPHREGYIEQNIPDQVHG
jgi:hypothetical protein